MSRGRCGCTCTVCNTARKEKIAFQRGTLAIVQLPHCHRKRKGCDE